MNMRTPILATLCAFTAIAGAVSAAPPTYTEGTAPASIKKMAPQGATSGRFLTLNYGVSGGKILLHAFYVGEGEAATGYIDVISPKGKKIQRFELEFPAPVQSQQKYLVKPLWLVPGKQKQPMVVFEGLSDHLMLVFPRGFGVRGSMQLFSERGEDGRRETTFNEVDKRGFRLVRVDVNEPGDGTKPAFKETIYYQWNGEKYVERRKK